MPVDFNRMTGKKGYVRFIDDMNVRTKIPITSWDADMETVFHDVTGSMNYNPSNGIVYSASVPVIRSITADVRGYYWREKTPPHVIAKLFDGSEPFKVELGYSPLDSFVEFFAWVDKFSTSSPIADTVRFTCSLRSNGTITDLANLVAGPLNPDQDDAG